MSARLLRGDRHRRDEDWDLLLDVALVAALLVLLA